MVHKNTVRLIALTFVAVMATPSMASEISCQYDSNSEWPWLDSRVCQLDVRPLIFDDEGTPVCSSGRADKDGDGWGWENNASCIIDPDLPEKESDVPGLVVNQKDVVVFEQDFESAGVGTYTPEILNRQWHTPLWHMGLKEGRASIVADSDKGKALQILFPAYQYGSKGAVAFLNDLSFGSGLERNFEELYVSYDMKFSENFEFVAGGKLPGLCGYNVTQEPRDGCNTGGGFPTGYDGWSARGMWRADGKLENYMYHADQFYEYGDDEYWSSKAVPGKWHTVQHRIVLNTVGAANGIVEAWIDGVQVLRSTNMLFRKTGDIGINLFYFSTFYGGADPSWAPASDQFMYYDNFRIATTPLPDTANYKESVDDSVDQPAVEIAAAVPQENMTQENMNQESTAQENTAEKGVKVTEETQEVEANLESASNSGVEASAAMPIESGGGGVFYSLFIGLLIFFRRKGITPR